MNKKNYNPSLTILIILFTLSLGFNIIFYSRVNSLNKMVLNTTSPVSREELSKLSNEIQRLSNIQYDLKTKQPIENDLIPNN